MPDDQPLTHIPVLVREVLSLLTPQAGGSALDCTCGQGGHTSVIAQALGHTGTMIVNDADPGAVEQASALVRMLPRCPRVVEMQGNYAETPRRLVEQGLKADCVLADLGFSSVQMGDANRGLSFQREGPLDMRFDPGLRTTAADLVNTLSQEELEEVLREFGEEPKARAIARKLIAERETAPIDTTSRLASLVRLAVGGRRAGSRIDPATRTFQALRIAVNDELGSLRSILEAVTRSAAASEGRHSWLTPGARIAFISFHSLEDRLVKNAFRQLSQRGLATLLTKKPITPSDREVENNPRSRSAKLRAIRLQT